ncbi:MAG: hypothetical protein ISR65_14740 [Bacteriovoracaceae bacterium]|nr:hypothetical protein [Bacteriovoracaceae bacterium]
MGHDLSKAHLYESVKSVVDLDGYPHLHFCQHKLFCLFSIAFQYFLFQSTKKPGAYIIRIEDSMLADKLARRAKDQSTRRFLNTLLLPRKYKYNKSVFYLDFFHIGSWNLTNDIPKKNVQGAIIVKNSSSSPMNSISEEVPGAEVAEDGPVIPDLPPNYFYTSLQEFVPKTVIIAYESEWENTHKVEFPFIKKQQKKTISGVTLGGDLDWDSFE